MFYTSRVPAATLADLTKSPALTLPPSAAFHAQHVEASVGADHGKAGVAGFDDLAELAADAFRIVCAGTGFASKICSVLPSSVVHAPGAGLQPRISGSIWRHDLPQSMRAVSAVHLPS